MAMSLLAIMCVARENTWSSDGQEVYIDKPIHKVALGADVVIGAAVLTIGILGKYEVIPMSGWTPNLITISGAGYFGASLTKPILTGGAALWGVCRDAITRCRTQASYAIIPSNNDDYMNVSDLEDDPLLS